MTCRDILVRYAAPPPQQRGAHLFAAAAVAEQAGEFSAALLLMHQVVAIIDTTPMREALAAFVVGYATELGEDLIAISLHCARTWPAVLQLP